MHYSPNSVISLHKKSEAGWWIREGSVCLFAVDKINGARHNIASFEAPAFLFPIESEDPHFNIQIVVERPSAIEEGLIADAELAAHLDKWLWQLSNFQKNVREAAVSLTLPHQGEISIPQNTIFEAKREINPETKGKIYWLDIEEGEIGLFSYSGPAVLGKQEIYPLAQSIWMRSIHESKIKVFETKEAIEKKKWKKGLEGFHRLFLLFVRFSLLRSEKQELIRLKERENKEQEDIEGTLKNLASILTPQEKDYHGSKETLFRACQILGNWQKIEFCFPKLDFDENKKNVGLIIQEIAYVSELRFREVVLSHTWWKDESGPLLGFYEKKPVVFVNITRSYYTMIDPETGKKTKINQEIAAKISHYAYYFYRSFPDDLKTAKQLFGWFFSHNHRDLISLLIYGVLGAIISLFFPLASALLFSVIIPDIMTPILWQICIAFVIATITSSIFFLLRSLILTKIQGLAVNEIWAAFWDRLFKLPISFFHKISSGDLFSRMNSLEWIREQLSSFGARVFLSGLFSLFYFIMMALYSIKLTTIPIFTLIICTLNTWLAINYGTKLQKIALGIKEKINGALVQMIQSIAKLRVFGAETGAYASWGKLFVEVKHLDMATQSSQNIVLIVNSILTLFAPALLFALSIHLQIKGEIPIWVFFAFNAAFLPFMASLIDVSNTAIVITSIIPHWERLRWILQEPIEITKEKLNPGKLMGDISIDHLFFRYDLASPFILNDISLHIQPKKMVAIVGFSGSGKSTLIKTLLGFEKPQSGAIFFDGKDLSQLNLQAVRKQIGVVLQESNFIAGSLLDNITCGGIYSNEEIEEALNLSGFDEELKTLPMGLYTPITGASTFSGGQKQKLLIARSLVGRPKILIFDEAMSSLDNKSQDRISRKIDQLEITRILISHRLSTVREADQIYVLDKGKIAQSGTFEELAKEKGVFSSMLTRQQI